MACFHPIEAWQLESGEIVFSERGVITRALSLPCGRCIGCRLVRVRSWAIRCVHEAQMHRENCFVTLTYDDLHYSPSLNYRDFQLFMKRLRKTREGVRFFACGEYGEQTLRPHFHALLFGTTFYDGVACGKNICSSAELNRFWPYGFSSFGEVSYESAAYVARYACSKVTGARAESHYIHVDLHTGEYVRVVPEFGHMSLKPGIGYSWFQKYWRDVYVARDGVVRPGGFVAPAPRYYDTLLESLDGDLFESKDFDRYVRSGKFVQDCTVERLRVREECAMAKLRFLRRVL